jgi:hypothetical protein
MRFSPDASTSMLRENNPNHDPKNGRFTFAKGASASSRIEFDRGTGWKPATSLMSGGSQVHTQDDGGGAQGRLDKELQNNPRMGELNRFRVVPVYQHADVQGPGEEYNVRHQRGSRSKWNVNPSVTMDPKLMKRIAPFSTMTAAQHMDKAAEFSKRMEDYNQQYGALLGQSIKLYGDRPGPLISGIYSDHFPADVKDRLRALAHTSTDLHAAAHAHSMATRSAKRRIG